MVQKFKLAIADVIEFPVHLKLRDGGVTKDFRFHLSGKRLASEEARVIFDAIQEDVAAEAAKKATGVDDGYEAKFHPLEVLRTNITGWRGQTLVLADDEGTPAEFSPDALDALLSINGVAGICVGNYINALNTENPEAARRKN